MSEEHRYGLWAGNPRGIAENPRRCVEEVFRDMIGHQCSRRRGHGKDGRYCFQHAKYHPAEPKSSEGSK